MKIENMEVGAGVVASEDILEALVNDDSSNEKN